MKIYFTRDQLLTLKAKIKGLAAEGSRTRCILQTKKGESRDHYWNLKRSIGREARYHLIAYGLLRGKLYSNIEPNSNKSLLYWSLDFSYLLQVIHNHCPYNSGYWTPKRVKDKLFPDQKEAA
jgi:hypothetical protein